MHMPLQCGTPAQPTPAHFSAEQPRPGSSHVAVVGLIAALGALLKVGSGGRHVAARHAVESGL